MNPTCCTCGVLERGLRKLAIAAMALAMAVRIAWIIALAAVVALFAVAAVVAEGSAGPGRDHLHQGRAADAAARLPAVPPARVGRADVAPHL